MAAAPDEEEVHVQCAVMTTLAVRLDATKDAMSGKWAFHPPPAPGTPLLLKLSYSAVGKPGPVKVTSKSGAYVGRLVYELWPFLRTEMVAGHLSFECEVTGLPFLVGTKEGDMPRLPIRIAVFTAPERVRSTYIQLAAAAVQPVTRVVEA